MSEIEKLFERLPDLPAVPKVMHELILSLGDDNVDIGHLAESVRHDPTLSARVLRMANSAYFGAMHKIGSIQDAVTRIGLKALRTLVIASGMTTCFKTVPGVRMREFWHHALVSAGLARQFARAAGIDPEFAYTAALMHRIGELLLHLAYPAEAAALTAELSSASPAERCLEERDRLGVDHCAAGAELARLWNFPLAIRNGLAGYAYPLSPQASPFATVVALASRCAHEVVGGREASVIAESVDPRLLDKIVVTPDRLLDTLEGASDLLDEARSFI